MVSSCPHISKYSSPLTNPLGIVPSAPVTITINLSFMFASELVDGLHCYLNNYKSPQASRTLLSILTYLNDAEVWMVFIIIIIIIAIIIIIIIIIYSLEFFTSALTDGLSLEFEWQQVSSSLLSILAVLNNAVVWMVSTRPPTFKSSSLFDNPLVTVPKAPITIGKIVTFEFHSFFNSLARSRYLPFFSNSFTFILWSAGTAKSTILQILFFFCWLSLGLIFWPILGDPSECQSRIGVYVCYFLGQVPGCAYTICSYGQILISCTSPSGSSCRPSRV